MANYNCAVRTNYFHVRDVEAFKSLMTRVRGSEDAVDLWEEKDSNGQTVFGFGLYGGISGVCDAENDDSAYDEFIYGLQECVADDDAIIIFESGNEKLRYVVGSATIITSRECTYLDITSLAKIQATELLSNPDWETKCEY